MCSSLLMHLGNHWANILHLLEVYRIHSSPHRYMHTYIMTLNFACIIWHISQDRTSWTSHFKISKISGNGRCEFSGTFCFIIFLKFKKVHHVGEGNPFWLFLDFWAQPWAIALSWVLKSRKTLKGVPSPIHTYMSCGWVLQRAGKKQFGNLMDASKKTSNQAIAIYKNQNWLS